MASLRRHLASLGLTVVVCHLVMQVLMSAALCCERPSAAATSRAQANADCCEGTHPGQICPMHKTGGATGKRQCGAMPQTDVHDLFFALTAGGVLPPTTALTAPIGSEAAPVVAPPSPSLVFDVPLGPPPRA